MAWLTGWTYRRKLTIDSTDIDAALTNLPVAVLLNTSNFDFSKAKTDGSDIRFTDSDGSTLLKFERENHDTAGAYGLDVLNGGTASASSVNGGDVAANAVDNSYSSFWTSSVAGPLPAWVKYDLGAGVTKTAAAFTIIPRTADANGLPVDFKLQGSNNDSTWVDLYSKVGELPANWAGDTKITYTFTNSTAYRYYRLYITNTTGGSYVQVREWEVLEFNRNGDYWVKVPSVSSSVDTDFYMYYGNAGAADGEDPNNVWDSNYKSVLHLKETSTEVADEFVDSTGNGNGGEGDTSLGQTLPTPVDGKIYNGQDFTSSCILIPDDASLEPGSSDFSISFWINFDVAGNYSMFGRFTSFPGHPWATGGHDYAYFAREGGNIRYRDIGAWDSSFAWTMKLAQWIKFDVVRDGTTIYIYEDNVLVHSFAVGATSMVDRPFGWQLGCHGGNQYLLNGKMDEFRLSIGIARSAAWRKASYESEIDDLLTLGTEETQPITLVLEDVDTDIRAAYTEAIEDIDTDIRISKLAFIDIDADIRTQYSLGLEDLDTDIRVIGLTFEDLDADIRTQYSLALEDIDTDIRAVNLAFEDIDTDIRASEQIFIDIDTDIRAQATVTVDIDTDIRLLHSNFEDISTDIRVSHRIYDSQVIVVQMFFEEGQYLASNDVTINLNEVFGATKMQFRNSTDAGWSALETFATTKQWTLSPGDGDKEVYAQFVDIQGVFSDGSDIIGAVVNTATPPAVTIEAYTDETATVAILDSTYQTDTKPFFRWTIPIFNVPYDGFIYSLDEALGTELKIDTLDIVRNDMIVSKKAPASNMIFETTAGYFYYNADLKEYKSQEITASNGDATLDRIDVIYVGATSESLNIMEGIPSVSPVKPTIAEDGIELATVYVPATTTLSQDTTLTDTRQTYIELDRFLNEELSYGQHILRVQGVCANDLNSSVATFNLWISDDSPTIGEIKCYTDNTKTIELANGVYQTTDNTPYFEWVAAPAQPGPIRYYYTEDGTEPDTGDSFVTVNNYTPGVYADGIKHLHVKPYDTTTGNWGETQEFIFIYGSASFTDDTAVISGNTTLRQSLKEIQVREISWSFKSARLCRIYQPVAFDATLPFSAGDTIAVIYGATNATLFRGRIKQIERTIEESQEGVIYDCIGPRGELSEHYAYTIHEDFGETAQIEFDDVNINTAINEIVDKVPNIVKNISSYPTGANISDEFIAQTSASILDNIYSRTKYDWYIKPDGSLVSVDLTDTNSVQAKFGVYGNTVHPTSPQYNIMSSNITTDITSRYNTCIIEGAKKRERVTLSGRCGASKETLNELVDEGSRASDLKYKIFTLDTKWKVVKIIETFITYARLKSFILRPFGNTIADSTVFTLIFTETEVCKSNNISRMIRKPQYNTAPTEFGTKANGFPGVTIPAPGESRIGNPSPMESKLVGFAPQTIVSDVEIQGTLGPANTVRFSRAMYRFWPTGVSTNSITATVPTGRSTINGIPSHFWRNPPKKRCASLRADVLIETVPLRAVVTVAGTASSVSKTLRIVKTEFKYDEDPDNPIDDTAEMTQYAEDILQKYKDINIKGAIILDTIDLDWDLNKTINLVNAESARNWDSINAKIIGINYNFDENTTSLEITTEYLK